MKIKILLSIILIFLIILCGLGFIYVNNMNTNTGFSFFPKNNIPLTEEQKEYLSIKKDLIDIKIENPSLAYTYFKENRDLLLNNIGLNNQEVDPWDKIEVSFLEASLLVRQSDPALVRQGLVMYRDMFNDETIDNLRRARFGVEIDNRLHGTYNKILRKEILSGKVLGQINVSDSEDNDMVALSRIIYNIYPHARSSYRLANFEAQDLYKKIVNQNYKYTDQDILKIKQYILSGDKDVERMSKDSLEMRSVFNVLIQKSIALTYLQKINPGTVNITYIDALKEAEKNLDVQTNEINKNTVLFYITLTRAMNAAILNQGEIAKENVYKIFDESNALSKFAGRNNLILGFSKYEKGTFHRDSIDYLSGISPGVKNLIQK